MIRNSLSHPNLVPRDRNPWRISGRPGPNDRPPLAAGHPVAWAVLTECTVLDGAPYPYPVFDTCP